MLVIILIDNKGVGGGGIVRLNDREEGGMSFSRETREEENEADDIKRWSHRLSCDARADAVLSFLVSAAKAATNVIHFRFTSRRSGSPGTSCRRWEGLENDVCLPGGASSYGCPRVALRRES